jgi:hypothetical protein
LAIASLPAAWILGVICARAEGDGRCIGIVAWVSGDIGRIVVVAQRGIDIVDEYAIPALGPQLVHHLPGPSLLKAAIADVHEDAEWFEREGAPSREEAE